MWDDVIIGSDSRDNLCSAVKVFLVKGEHGISENAYCYWINAIMPGDFGMKIYKNSKEGKLLTQMIEDGTRYKVIESYLFGLIVRNIEPEALIIKIKGITEDSYRNGHRAARDEFKKWLNGY